MTDLKELGIAVNQPLYLYQDPMFMLTVHAVIVSENGIYIVKTDDGTYKFPGGKVKASQETIQFGCVRHVKEQIGMVLRKEEFMPIDFRSDPERSKEKNVVDIGLLVILEEEPLNVDASRMEIDFENKCLVDKKAEFYMDHEILLKRAIEIILMVRDQ